MIYTSNSCKLEGWFKLCQVQQELAEIRTVNGKAKCIKLIS